MPRLPPKPLNNPSPDPIHDEFFKWVGICIKEWAKIENELFELCKIVLDTDPKRVAIVFYRTPSTEGRILLTDNLLETLWPKKPGEHDSPELIEWISMRQEIQKLLPVRNLLAHAPIRYGISAKLQTEIWHTSLGIEIATSAQEALKTGTTKVIRQADHNPNMEQHFKDVHAVWDRLLAYTQRLQQARPSKRPQNNPPQAPGSNP
jgi:hypothetical protein